MASSSFAADEPLVKLRLKRNQKSLALTGWNVYARGQQLSSKKSYPKQSSLNIRLLRKVTGHHWEIQNRDTGQIEIVKTAVLVVYGTGLVTLGRRWPEKLLLIPKNKNPGFDIIAPMGIDKYLSGVLPSEMPASWPREALKAQAVASRSYTLSVIKERINSHYHLESTIHDQVFNLNHLHESENLYEKLITDVIKETEGQVLTAKSDQDVFRAYYHSDCGGQTEEPFRVWNNGEKNGTVKDPSCPMSPHGNWKQRMEAWFLSQRLESSLGLLNPGRLLNILVSERSPTGRVQELSLVFSRHPAKHISAQEFRRVMGFNRVKSTNFEVTRSGNKFEIEGRGFGHGVGLCQWGSRNLAVRGLNHSKILQHYYPMARLEERKTVK